MKEKLYKRNPILYCLGFFCLCFAVHLFECLVIKTDQTILGENFINKLFGVALLFFALRMIGSSWKQIGFDTQHIVKYILYGLLLACCTFAVAFGIEMAILVAQGVDPRLTVYIAGFSFTGIEMRQTGIGFICLCFAFNLLNVWMEEGTFRGLFLYLIEGEHGFGKAVFITAVLFGVWHLGVTIQAYAEGSMTFAQMAWMSIGYVILAGLMSVKWSFLKKMTGSLWAGVADHFFNNFIGTNLLHVITDSGADELMIVRVLLAQLLSFTFVAILFAKRRRIS